MCYFRVLSQPVSLQCRKLLKIMNPLNELVSNFWLVLYVVILYMYRICFKREHVIRVCPVKRAMWWWTMPRWWMWRWNRRRSWRDGHHHLPREALPTCLCDCWCQGTARGDRRRLLWSLSPGITSSDSHSVQYVSTTLQFTGMYESFKKKP